MPKVSFIYTDFQIPQELFQFEEGEYVMINRYDYDFEFLEKYFGTPDDVKRKIENCPSCGEKMILTHFSDSGNMLVQETARCQCCDFGQRKVIHIIN